MNTSSDGRSSFAFPSRILSTVLLAAVMLLTCVEARGQEAFPDDWFIEGATRSKEHRAFEGKPAPDLSTASWIGQEVKLKNLRGKVVVVDFWATWCGPCMAAIPENVELVKEHPKDSLVFIGVHDANSGWDQAASVVKSKKINYPVAKDTGESAKAFGVAFWPTYVVIDKKGVIRGVGLIPSKVKDAVELLLKESSPLGSGDSAAANPAEWYFGGEMRPTWLKEAEGKKLGTLNGTNWHGQPVTAQERKGRVTVIQFMAGESAIGLKQLLKLQEMESELSPQGVSFLGVCDSRSQWEATKKALTDAAVTLPVVQDVSVEGAGLGIDAEAGAGKAVGEGQAGDPTAAATAEGGDAADHGADAAPDATVVVAVPAVAGTPASGVSGGSASTPAVALVPAAAARALPATPAPTPVSGGAVVITRQPVTVGSMPPGMRGDEPMVAPLPPITFGVCAAESGLRLSPVTVIVDRRGIIRAAGVKTDQIKAVVQKLLAEPMVNEEEVEDQGAAQDGLQAPK